MTTIVTKNSSTAGAAPTASDLVQGELAVNVTDKALYTENASGTVVKLNTPSIVDNGNATAITIDSSENVGVGVTPPTSTDTGNLTVKGGSTFNFSTASGQIAANAVWNGGWKYIASSTASLYVQTAGSHYWSIAPSGTAGNAISFTQAMTLDASGNLALGATSAASLGAGYTVFDNRGSTGAGQYFGNATNFGQMYANSTATYLGSATALPLVLQTGGTERARIDSSGNLLVGTTSGTYHNINLATSTSGNVLQVTATPGVICRFTAVDSNGGWNAALAGLNVSKYNTNSRSINAAGTVNASGTDYAEYMLKAGDFTIAKGDVVGISAEGKLTNVFANAVSFAVKSTDPSYVGGDSWGVGFEDDPEGLEAARQTVDRIAFSGQVPVNVTGATAGQYIVPVNDNGAIKGEAISNPTFEQYQQAVGKVIAIEQDGRARIIVKVA